jgi:hypothetical protein
VVPSAKLHTYSGGNGTYGFKSTASTGSAAFEIYESATNELVVMGKDTSGTIKWKIAPDESSYFNGGNVGIGTVYPGYPLHAYQAASGIIAKVETGSAADAQIQFVNTSDSWQIGIRATDNFSFWNGSDLVQITPGGQVQQAVATPAESGGTVTIDFSASNLQSISIDSDSTSSITLETSNLAAGHTVKLRIKDTGASGISVTEPTNWVTMGADMSSGVTAGGAAVVELTSWVTTDADVTAEWSVSAF